ncbi:hypothetical protein BRADI_1g09615v3 [Brachypodium distachyon]|uniref:Uncharacterized protein n=1 Tax=Brachypodium distachyon TaxID=15368 RepID=A0A2K2DIT8_BRADI|nr:hypothetical protein BRADI_1g09615v3 [Brachypodium distachyon]
MGVVAPPCQPTTTTQVSQPKSGGAAIRPATGAYSMSHSQGFHQQGSSGVYGFSSDGFVDRPGSSSQEHQQEQQQQHVAQQSRRDKLRVQQGFVDPAAGGGAHGGLLPALDGDEHGGAMYDHAAAAGASNMLAEMFNFSAHQTPPSATELLASQMNSANYRFGFRQPPGDGGWFGSAGGRAGGLGLGGPAHLGSLGETSSSPKHQQQAAGATMAGLAATDPAAAMQLFLMNPQQQQQSRSSPTSPPPSDAQSAIQHHEAFQAFGASNSYGTGSGVVEGHGGQGLSLSLSPSLQQLEMAKQQAEELRVRDGVLYFNRQQQQQQQQVQVQQLPMALHGGQVGASLAVAGQQLHVGYGPGPAGVAGVLRNSKYTRAAQELLDEFCSVGRGGQTIKAAGRRRRRPRWSPRSSPPPTASSTSARRPSSSPCSTRWTGGTTTTATRCRWW